MSPLHALAIFGAGIAAGTINTVVGSGTLITFPALLAFGYAPVTANVSNTVGLVPGSVSGAVGYRRELRGQRTRALPLAICSKSCWRDWSISSRASCSCSRRMSHGEPPA